MEDKYPGVEAYARGLYAKYRVERVLREIGATLPATVRTMNGAFAHAMEGISCDDFVKSVVAKCPPLYLMILEEEIQNGDITIAFLMYETRRYSSVKHVFEYADGE